MLKYNHNLQKVVLLMSKNSRTITLISILSLSAVSGVSTLITGITPQLQHQFPNVATTAIEWVVTLANLSALVTLLLNPFLTRKFGLRRVVITGLFISGVFGAMPALVTNFYLLLGCRIWLGLGIGLFSPHAISLIARVYHGELKARLLGYQTGISALGNALLLAVAGVIVVFSWSAVFSLYLLLLPIAVLAMVALPQTQFQTTTRNASAQRLPRLQLGLCLLAFVTYLIIWGVQLKLPSLFSLHHIGSNQVANWTLAAMNLGGLVAGLTFGRVHRHLQAQTLTLGYLGAAASVVVMLFCRQPLVVISAAVFFNYIYSYTGPYLVWRSSLGLSDHQIDFVSSALTVATIISAFFAPVVWNSIGHVGPGGLIENVLGWIVVGLGIIGVVSFGLSRNQRSA